MIKIERKTLSLVLTVPLLVLLCLPILGVTSILLMTPIFLYFLISTLFHIRKGLKHFFLKNLGCGISLIVLFSGHNFYKNLAVDKMLETSKAVKHFKTTYSRYPNSLEELKPEDFKDGENSYYSVTSGRPKYRFTDEPILWVEIIPPFGRVFYDFEKNEEFFLD